MTDHAQQSLNELARDERRRDEEERRLESWREVVKDSPEVAERACENFTEAIHGNGAWLVCLFHGTTTDVVLAGHELAGLIKKAVEQAIDTVAKERMEHA